MSESISLEDFYQYLSHVEKLYPHGVGESFISGEESPKESTETWLWGNGQVGVCFAVALPTWKAHPFESEQGMLLHAAISKGMKVMPEHVSIIDTNRLKKLNGELQDFLSKAVPEVVLILGKQANKDAFSKYVSAKPGETAELDSVLYMQAHSLEEIMSSPESKRQFWNSLKSALARLGTNV